MCGPHIPLFNGYRGVKRPEHEANHPPRSSAEVMDEWICNFSPHVSS